MVTIRQARMLVAPVLLVALWSCPAGGRAMSKPIQYTTVTSLSGEGWRIATDPGNTGRTGKWFDAPRSDARPTHVPWIIQDPFPGYHGVAWYWRTFAGPANPHRGGRTLLRFWAVDYAAEVWLNGVRLGDHEGGESPFLLDATAALKPGEPNLLAVRVLNPTHEPIDGIVLSETAHRNKALPYGPGSAWDQGGIVDDVEVVTAPAMRVADLFAQPDWRTGKVKVTVMVANAGKAGAAAMLFTVAPAASGETVASATITRPIPAGRSEIEVELQVPSFQRWELKSPVLYRVTARMQASGSGSADEQSARFGFRDFRVENGAFRLNGKRLLVRSSHTGNCTPIGLELPHDPDYLRRDLVNAKYMGFNMIRFIAGVPKRYQLDLCDEIGLMVYEESYAGWCMAYSPHFDARFDESILGMVRRDRNHPSVVMWGLLNETGDGPVFRHAVSLLPALRKLDNTRLVVLGSGRWDVVDHPAGIAIRRNRDRTDPCVTFNTTSAPVTALGITWAPGQLAMHPGRNGEYAAVRWTAPGAGVASLKVGFLSIAAHATTDVHVIHNGKPLFDAGINCRGGGPQAAHEVTVAVATGDTLDFVCGYGNGDYGADTTAIDATITLGGIADLAARFDPSANPHGAWSYGMLDPARDPDTRTFKLFPQGDVEQRQGGIANPGSDKWQDQMDDCHPYQRVPHTAEIIHTLRTVAGSGAATSSSSGLPVFVSEYGVGSSVDLMRVPRLYDQAGWPDSDDAMVYKGYRDRFLADWHRWKMEEAFARPEDFFAASIARMASQRLLGINALRSNPRLAGYSLTGTLDQGMTAEGLWTTFREPKPGTSDAVWDGFAPLRWCLFAEPTHLFRGRPVTLEAVLANEDALKPGKYPVHLLVTGPRLQRVFETTVEVVIPETAPGKEPPFAVPVFRQEVVIDGPSGRYRFTATFQSGAAANGEAIEFTVTDPADMPAVPTAITLFGEDPALADWLKRKGITAHAMDGAAPDGPEVILAAGTPPAAELWRALAQRVARGATVVFLAPDVLAGPKGGTDRLPMANKGALAGLNSWLYHKDDWCKPHPVFEGLPGPGLLDYSVYRELIPDASFGGLDAPDEAIAGAVDGSMGYGSGLLVASYRFGAGRFLLNALRIRECLDGNPAAERLLRNMLRWAGSVATKPAPLPADFDALVREIGYDR